MYANREEIQDYEYSEQASMGPAILRNSIRSSEKGPIGPLRHFRGTVMTKTTNKTAETKTFVVYGLDQDGKPRAARFAVSNADLVTKAAEVMKLSITEATTEPVAEFAKKLPLGRLYSTGKGFVPNVRRDLYIKLAGTLGVDHGLSAAGDEPMPALASGLPRNWDEIGPGHLVIAQETLEYGWWEAIVIERNGDMLTMRFRDHPKLPKFSRHRASVALISSAL